MGGITLFTSSCAESFNTPVGLPWASRTIWPPAGSAVLAVMPARRKVTELARDSCPSYRFTQTGVSGVTGSISSLVGRFGGDHFCSSQSPPTIHSPLAVVFTRSPILRANSSGEAASFNCTSERWSPPSTKCTCASLNPGNSSLPCASSTFVWGPCHVSTSVELPTATMRSPSTASASAWGRVLSTVQIFALVIMRSAAGFICPKAMKPPRRTTSVKIEIVLAILALMKILAIALSFSPLQLCPQYVKERAAGKLKELHVIFRFLADHHVIIPQRSSYLSIHGEERLFSCYQYPGLDDRRILHHKRAVSKRMRSHGSNHKSGDLGR